MTSIASRIPRLAIPFFQSDLFTSASIPMPANLLPQGKLIKCDADTVMELWLKPEARGVMIFYPGSMLDPGHYSLLLAALHEAGLNVCGLHPAGHGRNQGRKFTFQSILQQGLTAQYWLEEQGLGPAAVSGHSQGGILALAHAARAANLAACFAVTAVFPAGQNAINLTRFAPFAAYRALILDKIVRLSKKLPWLPVPLPCYLTLGKLIYGREKPVYMGKGRGRLAYPLRFLASLFSADIDFRLKCPFWLFAAVNDRLFTQDIIRETFDKIVAPEKRLIWLSGGGHMAPFNPAYSRFIARHCAQKLAGRGFKLKI